ncbi:hypothetical protein M1146_06370 [Patescibacteria group bacterium]|nr:hypothetical protein [Patescibacteria group bacterium]
MDALLPDVDTLERFALSKDPSTKESEVLVSGVAKVLSLVKNYGEEATKVNSLLLKMYQAQ